MQFKLKQAQDLKEGDVITWDSGYFDYIDQVRDTRLGDILIRCNGDTSSMIFNKTEYLKVIDHAN